MHCFGTPNEALGCSIQLGPLNTKPSTTQVLHSTTMSGFFSSLASKAQSAYEQSPLAGQVADLQTKLQQQMGSSGAGTGAGGDHKEHPTANEAAAQGGYAAKSRTLGNLTHQFRNIQMQLS